MEKGVYQKYDDHSNDDAKNPIIEIFDKMMKEECDEEYDAVYGDDVDNNLYDPNVDEEDEKVIQEMFNDCDDSDATLNCPGCMSLITTNCQQHESRLTEFRAMFVINCAIDRSCGPEVVPLIKNNKKRYSRNQKHDEFYPVVCKQCSTRLGMIDSREVYHFTCVLAN